MKRTDLAIEACAFGGSIQGIKTSEDEIWGIKITRTDIESEEAAKRTGRGMGRYTTLEIPDIAEGLCEIGPTAEIIAREIKRLLPRSGSTLVIGLGNVEITPDALGPRTADGVLATRHLSEEFKKQVGLQKLRTVSVLSPGVLGQTGMESAEVIASVGRTVRPDAIIAIDALAAADVHRLGNTVQLSDSGISPGSGVGNRRQELSERTLGVKVISIGIPTVTDSSVFGSPGGFIVTPREIDMLISRASELLAHAINFALQPETDRDILLSLV